MNDFDDFTEYFQEDKDHGSVIAKLLRKRYSKIYQREISERKDVGLDEDFNINFIDNFVHVILNNVIKY